MRCMGVARSLLCSLPLLACLACAGKSDGDSSSGAVSGAWCGREVSSAEECVGDEVFYVELEGAAAALSGQACEAYGKECYALIDATLQGRELTYSYEFSGYRVDADLTLGADGETLSGVLFATKCGCEIPITLHRI